MDWIKSGIEKKYLDTTYLHKANELLVLVKERRT